MGPENSITLKKHISLVFRCVDESNLANIVLNIRKVIMRFILICLGERDITGETQDSGHGESTGATQQNPCVE